MASSKSEHKASYRPMPQKNRFWIHSENCYTEEELALREWILKTRANSGIDPEYLTNPSSWFAENDQALVNLYENSWVYSNTYKTRQALSRSDFYVKPIDSQRLQWPDLYDLMQNIGDYLLLRNRDLLVEHLNQPMNFFLLDINSILNRLSQNPNIGQVKQQLELLNQYVWEIEKNIPSTIGSDKLFLDNFRNVIDNQIEPYLNHRIESQLLTDRLGDLSKTIDKLSTERNRILHFALNANQVNPHPYGFSKSQVTDSASYPTQAAKKCGNKGQEIFTDQQPASQLTKEQGKEVSTYQHSALKLTKEQLKDCPNFKLISMADDEILNHYAAAMSDLNELDRFQNVINEIMELLGQAGEVYTIHQFREQMKTLLEQINGFIDQSSQHIDAIIHANTDAYHQAIQFQQDLPAWKKWLSSEKEALKVFIKNQETLAQFPSRTADLLKTNKELKGHVTEVINHLNQPKDKMNSFKGIQGQAQGLNKLMSSMHEWIKIQHENNGLEAPEQPEILNALSSPGKVPDLMIALASPTSYTSAQSSTFFSAPPLPLSNNQSNNTNCNSGSISPQTETNHLAYLGLISLIPIGLIIFYLIYTWNNKDEAPVCEILGSENEFDSQSALIDDAIEKIKDIERAENTDLSIEYEHLIDDYDELKIQARKGIFNIGELKEIYEDLMFLYKELMPGAFTYS